MSDDELAATREQFRSCESQILESLAKGRHELVPALLHEARRLVLACYTLGVGIIESGGRVTIRSGNKITASSANVSDLERLRDDRLVTLVGLEQSLAIVSKPLKKFDVAVFPTKAKAVIAGEADVDQAVLASMEMDALHDEAKRDDYCRRPTSQAKARFQLHTLLAPGGGLTAHEDLLAHRHLLERHIEGGKQGLHDRLRLRRNRKLDAVSSFVSRAAAEHAIASAILSSQSEIEDWLRGEKRIFVLRAVAVRTVVGFVLRRGDQTPRPTSRVRLILLRAPESPIGYFIKTGFPVP